MEQKQKLTKRAIASRANGAFSRGPRSLAGKARSSRNAIRHGLLAKCVVLNNESQDVFNQALDQYLEKLNPTDGVEHSMVEEMVAAQWRLRRLWSIETTLFNEAVNQSAELETDRLRIASAFSDLASSDELKLLDRYEARLHRAYQRSLHNLVLFRELAASSDDADLQPDEDEEVEPETTPLPNEPSSTAPTPENHPLPNQPNSPQDPRGADVPVRAQSPDCAAQEPTTAQIPNEPRPPKRFTSSTTIPNHSNPPKQVPKPQQNQQHSPTTPDPQPPDSPSPDDTVGRV